MTKLTPREVIASALYAHWSENETISQKITTIVLATLHRAGYVIEENWKPIAEAPDNERLLLFCPDRGPTNPESVELGYAAFGWAHETANNMSYHSWATAFRPLPAPPKEPRP